MLFNLSDLAMLMTLNLTPLVLFLLISYKCSRSYKIKEEPEEQILDEAHHGGLYYIRPAYMQVLSIYSLEERGHCQYCSVNCIEHIEAYHKREIELFCYERYKSHKKPEYFDLRRKQLIKNIVKI